MADFNLESAQHQAIARPISMVEKQGRFKLAKEKVGTSSMVQLEREANMPWIDILKGLGITAVVAGHIFTGVVQTTIYMFHMPLFFLVSGYLFKPIGINRVNAIVRSLLIPSFIVICLIIILFWVIPLLLSGGVISKNGFLEFYQKGNLVVIWFPFVLSAVIICFELVASIKSRVVRTAICVSLLVLSYVKIIYAHIHLPFSLEVTPHALALFAVGNMASKKKITVSVIIPILVASSLIFTSKHAELRYDMYRGFYGIIAVSFVYSILLSFSLACFAKISSCSIYSKYISILGKYSLVIMFIHQPIQISMRDHGINSPSLRLCLVLLSCFILVLFVSKNKTIKGLITGRRVSAVVPG